MRFLVLGLVYVLNGCAHLDQQNSTISIFVIDDLALRRRLLPNACENYQRSQIYSLHSNSTGTEIQIFTQNGHRYDFYVISDQRTCEVITAPSLITFIDDDRRSRVWLEKDEFVWRDGSKLPWSPHIKFEPAGHVFIERLDGQHTRISRMVGGLRETLFERERFSGFQVFRRGDRIYVLGRGYLSGRIESDTVCLILRAASQSYDLENEVVLQGVGFAYDVHPTEDKMIVRSERDWFSTVFEVDLKNGKKVRSLGGAPYAACYVTKALKDYLESLCSQNNKKQ